MKLSVVIPAYNEEKRIAGTLDVYLAALDREFGGDFEALIVCDGCLDRTPEIVRSFAARHPAVRLLTFPRRLGKGGGVRAGFEVSRGEIVGFVDADGAFPVEDVLRLIRAVEAGADCAIASKWKGRRFFKVSEPFFRKAGSRALSVFLRLAFGLRQSDTQAGCKFFKGNVLRSLPPLRCRGWEFDVELLWRITQRRGRIEELFVPTRHIEGSKFRMRGTVRMFWNLVRLRLGLLA